jgi:holo-[acyl-carrier protein] synthase
MPFLVGTDLVDLAEIEESLDRFGEAYLQRVYSGRELAAHGRRPQRLAACFAAKEAALKALRIDDEPVDLRTVEMLPGSQGTLEPRLSGAGAALAAERGAVSMSVSASAARTYASAIAIVETATEGDG